MNEVRNIKRTRNRRKRKVSKALVPLLEPIRNFRSVRTRLSDISSLEKPTEELVFKAYLLLDKNNKTPKYVLLRQSKHELPHQIVATIGEDKLLLTFDLDTNDTGSNVHYKVATCDIVISGKYAFRIVPIASSFVIDMGVERVETDVKNNAPVQEKRTLPDFDVKMIGKDWKGKVKDLFNGNIVYRDITINGRNKRFSLKIVTDKQKSMLFVNGNNLENLTDISPSFLSLDISEKYVMSTDEGDYYGAIISPSRVKSLLGTIGKFKVDNKV